MSLILCFTSYYKRNEENAYNVVFLYTKYDKTIKDRQSKDSKKKCRINKQICDIRKKEYLVHGKCLTINCIYKATVKTEKIT